MTTLRRASIGLLSAFLLALGVTAPAAAQTNSIAIVMADTAEPGDVVGIQVRYTVSGPAGDAPFAGTLLDASNNSAPVTFSLVGATAPLSCEAGTGSAPANGYFCPPAPNLQPGIYEVSMNFTVPANTPDGTIWTLTVTGAGENASDSITIAVAPPPTTTDAPTTTAPTSTDAPTTTAASGGGVGSGGDAQPSLPATGPDRVSGAAIAALILLLTGGFVAFVARRPAPDGSA